ncbi:MAG: hypothetical protein ABI342_04030 [Nitrososphaera sp.]|jgi:antitoxin component of MazEF toxin-antitoxin module
MSKTNIRKIGKIGYTRTLSLPLFWLTTIGLDAGDMVVLTISKNNELIVKPFRSEKDAKKK